jgi:hypothetical protein
MNEDPNFATFWAIFPRKDRKIEARYEWQNAARRFPADRIILTAARYCAQVQGRPRTEIMTAAEWLPGLIEPERLPGVRGLDLAKIGGALLTVCMTSWQLGHSSVKCTIRDYLSPHGPYDAEHEFAYQALLGVDPHDMISEEDALEWLTGLPLATV